MALNTSNPFAQDNAGQNALAQQAQREEIENAANQQKFAGLQGQVDSITGLGGAGLSQRQKATALSTLQGEAGKMGMALDTGVSDLGGLSARQKLGTDLGVLSAQGAITDFNKNRELQRLSAMNGGNKLPGYAQGGKIKGPGTATSDSIPAKVVQTGEPIRVSNGERIVSAEQDQALLRIAELLGYESVDAMLEALTGKPVGPTIKDGQRAAKNGAGSDDWMRTHQTGDRTSIDYNPQPQAPKMDPADAQLVQNASANFNKVFSDKDFVKPTTPEQAQATADHEALATGAKKALAAAADVVTLPGRAIADGIGAAGNAGARIINAVAGKPVITDRYQSSLQNYGMTPFYDSVRTPETAPQPQAAPAPTTVPKTPEQQTQQAPTGAGTPGAQILGTQPLDLTGRQQQYMENNNIREFRDVGNGIVRTVDGKGNRVISNVGTGDITDPNKRAVDDSASALIDQKNSTYNPFKQYENMLRIRMMSDAFDPTIRDPYVRSQAQAGLAILNAGQQGSAAANLHNAQAGQANALTAQTQQMEAMRAKLMDKNTPQEEVDRITKLLTAINGKGDATYDGHVVKGQIGDPDTFVTWDKRTGRPVFAGTGNELQQQQKAAAARPTYDQFRAQMVKKYGDKVTDQQLQAAYKQQFPGAK